MTVDEFIKATAPKDGSDGSTLTPDEWVRVKGCLSFANGRLLFSPQNSVTGCPLNPLGQELNRADVQNIDLHHRLAGCPVGLIDWYCCAFDKRSRG